MAAQLDFELVSPIRRVVGKAVTMVTVPGEDGDFGVLPGHVPLIATLRPGVIEVYEGASVTDRIFVAGGFAEVSAKHCAVLAQEAVPVASLVRGELDAEITRLDQAVGATENESDKAALTAKRSMVLAKLAALH